MIGAGNRTEEFKGWTLTYDADGNVISKANGTDTWTYTWDAFNKLTHVRKNGVVELKFMYDAFGRRVIRCFDFNCSTAERLVNDGDQLVLARSGTGPVTDIYGYYPGGDHPLAVQFQSGKKLVYITDPQLNATVRGLADTNRTATNPLVKDYTIGPWGEVAADTGLQTRLKLAGQQYDQETGLYYMRARYYDPALGRFLSEDPIGIAGGLNLYAYAGNDPVNQWDPTGMDPDIGGDCTLSNGKPGALDKKGNCIPKYTLPDIEVASDPPPLSDDPPGLPIGWLVPQPPGGGGGGFSAWDGVKSGSSSTAPSPSASLGPPVLVRRGTPHEVVVACIRSRNAVKRGTSRALFGLPLFPGEVAFGGRLPDVGGIPVDAARDIGPSMGWAYLQKGTAEAVPAFQVYQGLDCRRNVIQSD